MINLSGQVFLTAVRSPFAEADALLAEADAFVDLGVTLLTVGVNGPDYDLTQAEALCRWRDRRQ